MKTNEPVPVSVCHVKGTTNRFFGKYRDPEERNAKKRWKRIPGGMIPPEFDTEPKALVWARRWYALEMAERSAKAVEKGRSPRTWADVCDGFVEEVGRRKRGADGAKDELKKRAKFLRTSPILAARPVEDHNEVLALTWLRELLSAPKRGASGQPRDALTVRNIARVLREIYKFARACGALPHERRLPTESDEFREEVNCAVREKAKLGKLARVAVPMPTVVALVTSPDVGALRRITTRTYFYTGLRPGELHATRISDFRKEHGVLVLSVREQWTLPRTGFPSRLAPPKTRHGIRKIPVHPSLEKALRAWIDEGWRQHVGRAPKPEDFLFPDAAGNPFREQSCEDFLADVAKAGCETKHNGVRLEIYSLRHAFATAARRAGVVSDTRDRVLGHGPRDTKAKHYEDEDLPFDARELAKMPSIEDHAPSPIVRTEPTPGADRTPAQTTAVVTAVVTAAATPSWPPPPSSTITVEEARFELADGFHHRRFSKPLPSTTRPLLQALDL